MIIKEFVSKDTENRNRVFAECSCSVCGSVYTKQKRFINEWDTCSAACTRIAKGDTLICTCSHCGGSFTKAKSKVLASKSGKVFCSRKCKDTAQSYMIEIQPDHYGTGTGISSYRTKALKAYKNICADCGYNNILALDVHHIDEDRSNNELSNLVVLCCNCHAIRHRG